MVEQVPLSIEELRATAGRLLANNDLAGASGLADRMRRSFPALPDGWYLQGVIEKRAGRAEDSAAAFEEALSRDDSRFDIGIELANQHLALNRYREARALIDRYGKSIGAHPVYLDMAGQICSTMGLHRDAWPFFEQALAVAPDAEAIRMHAAACAVVVGETDKARALYESILQQNPSHQRVHYELSRIDRAVDDSHIQQMLDLLDRSTAPPERNIFLYYALAKEYEDLERWEDSFACLERGGNAARKVSQYDIQEDIEVIDAIIETCDADWLASKQLSDAPADRTPVFVVGLPRTGTTLTDRILSSHSPRSIAEAYLQAIRHRLGPAPYFVEKLPENLLYLGFIAAAWPEARIVHLRRHPLDACFAMFKQSFFRFAYTLDDLAQYYLAYDRLSRHWKSVLGGRLIELQYEALVAEPEAQIRRLFERTDIPFEAQCLDFDRSAGPVATASATQVREKAHTRSVGKWKKFAQQLEPLRAKLESGGVEL
jgi:tetratricopeptide (TPR) repeat protein